MELNNKKTIVLYMGEERWLMSPVIRHFYGYSIDSDYFENIKELDDCKEISEAIQRCIQYIIDTPPSKQLQKKERKMQRG